MASLFLTSPSRAQRVLVAAEEDLEAKMDQRHQTKFSSVPTYPTKRRPTCFRFCSISTLCLICSGIIILSARTPATDSRFPGLKDIRLVPNRAGIAFVEFESEELAAPARIALNNFKITPEQHMKVDYAKKWYGLLASRRVCKLLKLLC